MTAAPRPGHLAWAIAIPARNDADRIADCLAALACQRDVAMADGAIVVLACNTTDDTPRIARESRQQCALRVVQRNTASERCSSGEAQRLALAEARLHVRDNGILLTTDVNVIVDPTWVAAMLGVFADGHVDAVAGAISPYHDDAALDPRAALERRYWELITAVEDAIDPLPYDPLPRHGRESGSNFAIRAGVFDAIGGVPDVATGAARAMSSAVRARDGRVRHSNAPLAVATVPPRRYMEDSMAPAPRHPSHSRINWPAAIVERRLTLRRAARAAYAAGEFSRWALQHGVADWGAQAFFGSSWDGFIARSPGLAPTPVDAAALPAQIAMLEYLLAHA